MKYLNVILIGVIAICTVVLVFSLFTLNKRRQQRVTNITPNNQLSNAQEDSTKPALTLPNLKKLYFEMDNQTKRK